MITIYLHNESLNAHNQTWVLYIIFLMKQNKNIFSQCYKKIFRKRARNKLTMKHKMSRKNMFLKLNE